MAKSWLSPSRAQVELACEACKKEGKAAECVHMLHLIPRWQSSGRHSMLRTVMEDRPDLVVSELSGLAFDATQQIFKPELVDVFFQQAPPMHVINEDLHVFIDPAAGGPFSDYCVLTVTRQKGMITVRSFRTGPARAPGLARACRTKGLVRVARVSGAAPRSRSRCPP